jgi:TRAP-type C4-dicarboxylate transport system permease small subunit
MSQALDSAAAGDTSTADAKPALLRAADVLNAMLATIAGLALFVLMTLTFVDVMGRKFFVAVPGALEVSEMLMVVVLFAALPLVALRAEHVCFELVDSLYKGRAAQWSKVFMDGFCAVAFTALALAVWHYGARTMDDGEVSVYLRLPVGWFVYLMAVLLGVAALMHLLRAVAIDPHASTVVEEPPSY